MGKEVDIVKRYMILISMFAGLILGLIVGSIAKVPTAISSVAGAVIGIIIGSIIQSVVNEIMPEQYFKKKENVPKIDKWDNIEPESFEDDVQKTENETLSGDTVVITARTTDRAYSNKENLQHTQVVRSKQLSQDTIPPKKSEQPIYKWPEQPKRSRLVEDSNDDIIKPIKKENKLVIEPPKDTNGRRHVIIEEEDDD